MLGVVNAAIPPAACALATALPGRRWSCRTRAVDLDDPATGQAADTQRDVQGDGPGRDDRDGLADLVTEAHHRAFAVVLLNLRDGEFEGLLAVRGLAAPWVSPFDVFGTGVRSVSRDGKEASDKTAWVERSPQ